VQRDWDFCGRDRTPVASMTGKGFAMFDESNQLPREYERDLDVWTCAWYDAAIAKGYIR